MQDCVANLVDECFSNWVGKNLAPGSQPAAEEAEDKSKSPAWQFSSATYGINFDHLPWWVVRERIMKI